MNDKEKPGQLDDILRKRKELDEILDARFKRTATVLFTDIVGSTTFFSNRGDIEGQLMIQRHNDLLIPFITKHQGNLIEIVGDALLASFEEPSKAVACAVEMQEALVRDNQGRAEKDHIQVRIGINMGSGYVEGGHVHGIIVNITERIKSLASTCQILISESVYQSLQPGKDPLCTFLDKVRVKGIDDEIKVYQVVWRERERDGELPYNALRRATVEGDLVLEVSRENGHIKVSVYEKSDGGERTLRPYESLEVSWDQIEMSRREIITLLNRANKRARVTPGILDSLKKSGQILFDLLIPPKAREKIGSTESKNLIFYVDDKLVHIPWELLFDGKQFFCRRFAMGRIVSTRQAPTSLSNRTLKAPFKVLVVADPRGDLDASYREGMEVKGFLDEKREAFHVDFKSYPVDIPFVKKNLRDYDIVHYAGHADYHSENPSESGWLLKDGRLKASEISGMGGLQPMPSLVFSNACQTGHSGEWRIQEEYEQQIYGLANAYLLSGVQHYIGTFWEILDEPSCYFAKRFYSFLSQGAKVGEAVRRARQELIDAYGEEAIVWATYMLYGDPTFEFAFAEKETPRETVVPKKPLADWPHVMRGETAPPAVTLPVKKWRASYSGFASLLIGAVILGYFGWTLTQSERETPAPKAEVTPVVASAPEPKVEVQEKLDATTSVPQATPVKPSVIPHRKESKPDAVSTQADITPPRVNAAKAAMPPVIEVAKKEPLPPAAPAVAAPLTLSMSIIGQRKERDGSYTEVIVSEGSVLRSYDNFQVHLEANRATYVYVLIYDSQGKAGQLFPDAKIDHPGFIEAGGKAVIPRRDLWFWLDEQAGTETIYVLASEKPMSDVQRLLAKMQAAEETDKQRVSQEIKERIVSIQRGVGGITKGQAVTYTLSDGKKIQKVTEVVSGTGSVVRAISFHHR